MFAWPSRHRPFEPQELCVHKRSVVPIVLKDPFNFIIILWSSFAVTERFAKPETIELTQGSWRSKGRGRDGNGHGK